VSVASSVTLPHAALDRAELPAGDGRLRLLFGVIVVTSLSAFALSVASFAQPIGAGDALPTYAAIHPVRGYVWAFFAIAAVQLVVGACAAALAGWILTPTRGARWATVGGGLIWLGAAVYGVGVAGWAAIYFYATDTAVVAPATAARLVDHANDDTARMLAVPFGGALLVAIGSLLLAVALWQARTVPRWVPIIGAISTLATILIPPSTAIGVAGEALSSATTIALGWYAWQRHAKALA
jgi:hypothetical protein